MRTRGRRAGPSVAALVLVAVAAAGCVRASRPGSARLEPDAFRRLFEATVSVSVALPDGRTRVGSGFVASGDGWIVTSSHVVAPVTGQVLVGYSSGGSSPAGGIYTWAGRDLAVVMPSRPEPVEPLRLADSRRLRPGQVVFACGVPFGLGRAVTRGTIDGRSDFHSPRYVVLDGILAAGLSYPGDSGGPVVDAEGHVVGVHLGVVAPERRAVVPSRLIRRTLIEAQVQAELQRRQRELDRLTS